MVMEIEPGDLCVLGKILNAAKNSGLGIYGDLYNNGRKKVMEINGKICSFSNYIWVLEGASSHLVNIVMEKR
jgi:hypothetical protein